MKLPHKILPALAAAAVLLIAGCGDSAGSSSSAAAAGNPVDRAFVADMIPHHESAVEMAQIAQRRGTSSFVKMLADNIVTSQQVEISTMRAADQRLKAAGVAKGSLGVSGHMMGMDGVPTKLNSAKPFDAAFIQMMLPHHEGALPMAKAELAKGKDPELKKLATAIIAAQTREITQMRAHLTGKSSTGQQMDDTMGAG